MHWWTLYVESWDLNMGNIVKKIMLHVHSIWNNQQDEMEIMLKINVMIHVWNIFLDFEITKTDKNTMGEGCESKHYKGIFTINL